MRNFTNLPNGLEGSNLIVGQHHAHQCRIRPDCTGYILRIDPSLHINRQKRDLYAVRFQSPACIEHGMVLNAAGHHMPLPLCTGHAKQRPVIRFRSTRGKRHFLRPGSHSLCHRVSRIVNSLPCGSSVGIQPIGIARIFPEKRKHGLEHFRPHRRRRCVIQIDHSCRSPSKNDTCH